MKIVYIDGWYHVEQTWMSGKVIITPYRWKDKRIAQSYVVAFYEAGEVAEIDWSMPLLRGTGALSWLPRPLQKAESPS